MLEVVDGADLKSAELARVGSNPTARTRYSYKSLSFLLWRFTFKWNAFFGEYGREVMRRIVVPVYVGPNPSIHPYERR